jgi:alpha-beta hydrolase superfamily lysophospholipase
MSITTDDQKAIASWPAVSLVFEAAGSWCFGWHHAASQPARGVGVVLCRPIGYEAVCSYPTYKRLAENLAAAGFDVLRFDYHGTGDSAGSDLDPDRVHAWIDSTVCAASELQRLSGVSRLALFGVRLGATLAAQAAARLGGVESLVMWAPCVTGRAFARELRAANASRPQADSTDKTTPTAAPVGNGSLEAFGHTYTAQTLQDLNSLDCQRVDFQPAARALIIDRDDMPAQGPLPGMYDAMGMDTSYQVLPGYAAMMVEPHEGTLQHNTLGVIADWLSAAPRPQSALLHVLRDEAPRPVDAVLESVREAAIRFGPSQSLFGVLTEPAQLSASDPRSTTAILMLNTGGIYRIGPARLYVKMARAWGARGYRTFRFDLTGIGDSGAVSSGENLNIYSRDSTDDVKAAIDCLVARGCTRVIVMGICSGSYVAFQTALVDPRVTGQILMNTRLLECQDEAWQGAMQSYYKSTHFYRRALLQPDVYWRLIRGEVDVVGIARRFHNVFKARIKGSLTKLLQPSSAAEGVLSKVKRLSERGTDTLMISAAEDDGRDYLDFHFGPMGSHLRGNPNFKMIVVEQTDHTFSNADSQQIVIAAVHDHLESRLLMAA